MTYARMDKFNTCKHINDKLYSNRDYIKLKYLVVANISVYFKKTTSIKTIQVVLFYNYNYSLQHIVICTI